MERPFGVTVPVRVAVAGPTDCAAPVATTGAGEVLNEISPPVTVPASLRATTRVHEEFSRLVMLYGSMTQLQTPGDRGAR